MEPAWGKKNLIVLHFNKSGTGDLPRQFSEHIATHNFTAPYAAKKFIDATLLANEIPNVKKQQWIGPHRLWVNEWFLITVDSQSPVTLEELMELTYDKEESKWKLPHPYIDFAQRIAAYHIGVHPEVNQHTLRVKGKPQLTEDQLNDAIPGREKRKAKEPKKEKPVKIKKSKVPDGTTHVTAIAAELKMQAGEARSILRKHKIEKPYAWQGDELKRISALLKKEKK